MDDDVPLVIADLNASPSLLANRGEAGFVVAQIVPSYPRPYRSSLWDFIGLIRSASQTITLWWWNRIVECISWTGLHPQSPVKPKRYMRMSGLLGERNRMEFGFGNLPVEVSVKRVNREYGHIVHVSRRCI